MDWHRETFPGKTLPVSPIEPEQKENEETQAQHVQPFLLHSEEGQYVVLHRLNEVAPKECISWLKKNGPESFKDRLSGIKLCFEPASSEESRWNPVDKNSAKKFVHDFFHSDNDL
jgi:hypothetical protein